LVFVLVFALKNFKPRLGGARLSKLVFYTATG
jgi:hypothetical protein